MLAHLFPFVKNFSKFLQSFLCAALVDSLLIVPSKVRFVKGFLHIWPSFLFVFSSQTTVSGGKIAADFRQGVPRVDAGFVLHCQISQADHTAEPAVFHDGQSSDLLPAH